MTCWHNGREGPLRSRSTTALTVAASIQFVPSTNLLAFKCLVSSIKVEVKRKNVPCGWNFSCFAAQLIKQDLF